MHQITPIESNYPNILFLVELNFNFQTAQHPWCMISVYPSQKLIIQEGYGQLNLQAVRAPALCPYPYSYPPYLLCRSHKHLSLRLMIAYLISFWRTEKVPGGVNLLLVSAVYAGHGHGWWSKRERAGGTEDLLWNAITSLSHQANVSELWETTSWWKSLIVKDINW